MSSPPKPEEEYDGECFVCPYCKHRHNGDDPYGYDFHDEAFECGNCSKKFEAEVSTSVTYIAKPIEE